MYLIDSLLQKPTAIYDVAAGSFSGENKTEFAMITGSSRVDVLQVFDGPLGTCLKSVASCDTFSSVRAIKKVRVAGESVDSLAISSDSGSFVLVKLSSTGVFERVFSHTYGKSGCRRTLPGHILSVDPQGRAIALSALESNRIVYIIDREGTDSEQAGNIKFRSPLEANRMNYATVSLQFLYCELNPRMIIIEVDPSGMRLLSIFEVELGLNHISKKASIEIESSAYDVFPLKDGNFVVFTESEIITYRLANGKSIETVKKQPTRSLIIAFTSSGLFQHENGELINIYDGTVVGNTSAATLDELNGFIFSASIFGEHTLHQYSKDGLLPVYSIPNLAPLNCGSFIRTKSGKREDSVMLLAGTGFQSSSSLELIKPGLAIRTIASSGLPEEPLYVSRISSDLYAVGLSSSTLFLKVGDSIEEDLNPPFNTQSTYLLFRSLADNCGVIAVTRNGWRQVGGKTVVEFEGSITCACANERQLAVVLSDNQLVYFELASSGQMRKVTTVKCPSPATCLAFAPVPTGRMRSRFLMVGGEDSIVRLLSCDPSDLMSQIALQAAAKPPTSLLFSNIDDQLYVHVGLRNGVYVRLTVGKNDGSLNDPQSRYLGPAPILFHEVEPAGHLIAQCTKSWLVYSSQSSISVVPLACEGYFGFTSFSTPSIPNSIFAIAKDHFSLMIVENPEMPFNGRIKIPSKYTVRRVSHMDVLGIFLVIESESGKSRVSLYREDCSQLSTVEFEKPVGCAVITQFEEKASDWYLIVGLCATEGHHELLTYSVSLENYTLNHIHTTESSDKPHSIIPFAGKVLIGTDKAVRLYDLGKKKLLRKCEVQMPSAVLFLDSQGLRIYAGTSMTSVLFLIYRPAQNQLQCFADDIVNKPLSAMCVIDYETVCVADRLGCLSVLRVPNGLSESIEKDPAGLANAARETLFAAPHKLERVCEYTVGDTITVLSKGSVFVGARQSILYATISGMIGMLTPIQYRSTVDCIQTVETELRSCLSEEDTLPLYSLTGRHQLLRRSACGQTVKGVLDGQFCLDSFSRASASQQSRIANVVDKERGELLEVLKGAMQVL